MIKIIIAAIALLLIYGNSHAALIDPTTIPLQRIVTIVSGLPTCNSGSKGLMYFVTDALTPVAIATVSGGGAIGVGVMCNGSNWIVQ